MKRIDELAELRGLDDGALVERLANNEEELMNLRFRGRSGQLDNTARVGTLRRQIARIKTVISEKKGAEEDSA